MNSFSRKNREGLSFVRLSCLAVAIAGCIHQGSVYAGQLNVTSCGDAIGDTGTLRSNVAAATNNDVVSLASLKCTDSLITLTQGAIPSAIANLTITGSASNHVSISGNNADRVFRPTGQGTLTLNYLTIEDGNFTTPQFSQPGASGGCIYATAGSVALNNSTVTGCSVITHTDRSGTSGDGGRGGGIAAPDGSVTLMHSTISFNFVEGVDPNYSTGGGGISAHVLTAVDSMIDDNIAIPGSKANSSGGGALVETAIINNSAIVRNYSVFGGGLYIEGGTSSSTITNSTISGNAGSASGGGISSRNPLTLLNTTIAFNSGGVGAGLYQQDSPVTMKSSIIADNSNIYSARADLRLSGDTAIVSGSNNLITDTVTTLPADTLTSEPRLAPLALHGGERPVLPLLPMSPALDVGTNTVSLPYDERGQGYPRTFGAATDIGAYESQGIHDDELFYDGFSPLR